MTPDLPPFVSVVTGREVRHVTFPSPSGPMQGYQLRFQLGTPQADGSVVESWTEWLHLPDPLMLYLTESLDAFMRTEGHLMTPAPVARGTAAGKASAVAH